MTASTYSVANPFLQEQPKQHILASAYTQDAKDERNRLVLLPHELHIYAAAELTAVPLDAITDLRTVYRKWVGAIVAGGLVACFSLLGILFTVGAYMWLILTFFAGLFVLGIGHWGSWSIEVVTEKGGQYFSISRHQKEITGFCKLVHRRLRARKQYQPLRIAHIVSRSDWMAQEASSHYHHPSLDSEGFIHTCEPEQVQGVLERSFKGQDDLLLLWLKPELLEAKLLFEPANDVQDYFPHVFGPINKSAIEEIVPVAIQRMS